MRKEYLMDDSMKKTIKDISEIITGEDKVKSKVADYIKGMKSKIEMKLFIVFLYRRLNDMLRKFIEEIKKTENEEELSPSFFSILLIDSFFEKKEKILKLSKFSFEDNLINQILIIVKNSKLWEGIELIYTTSELDDFVVNVVKSVNFLYRIKKYVEQIKISNEKFVKITCKNIITELTFFSFEIFINSNLKQFNDLIEKEDNLIINFFNNISSITALRFNSYIFLLKFLTNNINTNKNDITIYAKFVDDNKRLDMMLSLITNIYIKKNSDSDNLYNELYFLLLIFSIYSTSFSSNDASFIHNALNLMRIISVKSTPLNTSFLTSLYSIDFISQLTLSNFLSQFEFKLNLTLSTIPDNQISNEKFERCVLTNLLLSLYTVVPLGVKSTIVNILLSSISLDKYTYMISNTTFISSIVNSLYQSNEEIIVRYFNTLLFMFSDNVNTFDISNEMISIVKSLKNITNHNVLSLFIKQLKCFIDVNNVFQFVICNNGILFREIKTMLDMKRDNSPFEVQTTNKGYDIDMLCELIDFMESLLVSNVNKELLKSTGMIDVDYYSKFVLEKNKNLYMISYRLWSIDVIYNNENEDIMISSHHNSNSDSNSIGKRISNVDKGNAKRSLSFALNRFAECDEIKEKIAIIESIAKIFKKKKIRSMNEEKLIDEIVVKGIEYIEQYDDVKKYIDIVIELVQQSNYDVITMRMKDKNEKEKFDIGINKNKIEIIVKGILDKLSEEKSIQLINELFDIEIITEDKVSEIQKEISIYGNKYIHNGYLLIIFLSISIKQKKIKLIEYILQKIYSYSVINDSNKFLFISHSIISHLLCLLSEDFPFSNLSLKILSLLIHFIPSNDLSSIYTYIIINIKQSNTLQLINVLNDSISHKYKHSISLSHINTKQPSIYNMIYSNGIKLASKKTKAFASIDKSSHSNCLCILISLKMFNFDINSKFILFSLSKSENSNQIVEVSLYKNCLIVKEGDNDISNMNHNISNMLSNGKSTKFLIILYQSKIEIFVNGTNIYMNIANFHSLDFSSKSSYSFIIGYPSPSTKEGDTSQISYKNISHVDISYITLFTDLISNDFKQNFNLSKISSSKFGSLKQYRNIIRYLNYNNYKSLMPTYESSNKNFFNLNLDIDKTKIVYECVVDSVDVMTHRDINEYKNDEYFNENFIMKLNRKFFFDISDKDFIAFIPNTNIKHKKKIFTQHTYLLSKYNIADTLISNRIFDINSIINDIISKDIAIRSSYDYSMENAKTIENIIMMINSLTLYNEIQNRSEILLSLIKLFSSYMQSHLYDTVVFTSSSFLFQTFITLFNKCPLLINQAIIDQIVALAYGAKAPYEIASMYDPLFPNFLTDFLLDISFFSSLSQNNKEIVLYHIKKIISIDHNITNINYSFRLEILKKLYHILLSDVSSSLFIDTKISEVVTCIIGIMFKYKKGIAEANDDILIDVISSSLEYLKITDVFSQSLSCHLEQRNFTNDELNATNDIIKEVFAKLYDDTSSIKPVRKIILNYFLKLNDDIFIIKDSNPNANTFHSKALSLLSLIVNYSGDYVYEEDNEHINMEEISNLDKKKNNTSSNENSSVISGIDSMIKVNFANKQSQCTFCNYITTVMKREYDNIKRCLSYKKFIKNFIYTLSAMNDYDDRIHKFLSDDMKASLSYYVYKREGPSRIINKMKKKIDLFSNEEMTKKFNHNNEHVSEYTFTNKNFNFELSSKLHSITCIDEIFNLKFVSEMTERNDIFDSAYNIILFNGLDYITSIIVLGRYNIYIMKNIFLDKNGILYYNLNEDGFRKIFWGMNEYSDELDRHCDYLGMKNKGNVISRQMMKFSYKKKEFKIYQFNYRDINEIRKTKFLHQNNSIELHLKNGKSFLFTANKDKRDFLFFSILSNIPSKNQIISSNSISSQNCIYLKKNKIFVKRHKGKIKKGEASTTDTKIILDEAIDKWSTGLISNYDYLMLLNTLAGRSYNNLSQYPIMPWILKDYSSNEGINLNNNDVYRNLSYPIFAQDKASREGLKIKYENSDKDGQYHSGTHYSSPGFVAYFMIRTKPYSIFASEIQGGYFDTPDRLFSNLQYIWDVSEKYEELIPQMYYFPEVFENLNRFEFGCNQGKKVINDVELPKWSCDDPRLFVKMKKKALESCFSSQKISDWIDLVFGYKQSGKEAVEYYNTFREVCYPFDINMLISKQLKEGEDMNKILEEMEYKMNEICEMGQNPIQLFTRPHIKKERHQKNVAFFSKCAFLMNLKPKEKEHTIKLNSFPNDFKGKYEIVYDVLSQGEGGLSSFRTYVSDNSNYDMNSNKAIKRNYNYFNTFFFVGQKHLLIGPKYQNFIDYSKSKYSFYIVKPFDKIIMEYQTNETSPIEQMIITNDGRFIYITYKSGKISKYKLKKEKDDILIHPDYEKKHKDLTSSNKKPSRLTSTEVEGTIKKKNLFLSKSIKNIFSKSKTSNKQSSNMTSSVIKDTTTKDTIIRKLTSNNAIPSLNECIYPTIYFTSIPPEDLPDYFIHYTTQDHPKIKKDLSKGSKYYVIKLLISSSSIFLPLIKIELIESFGTIISIDIENNCYLIDMNSLIVLHKINLSEFVSSPIEHINICPYTGDFTLSNTTSLILSNINGVILTHLDIKNDIKNGTMFPITSCLIQTLKNTESDIYLFTGHSNGSVILWKLENDRGDYEYIDVYRYKFDTDYHHKNQSLNHKFKINFTKIFMIECTNSPIKMMKFTEDLSGLFVLNEEMSLLYLGYDENIELNKKKTKQMKTCPQCSAIVGNSKICCVLCNKKLCSYCKIEQKIPECSLKNPKPICEDCLKMISSSNKMLYDF